MSYLLDVYSLLALLSEAHTQRLPFPATGRPDTVKPKDWAEGKEIDNEDPKEYSEASKDAAEPARSYASDCRRKKPPVWRGAQLQAAFDTLG